MDKPDNQEPLNPSINITFKKLRYTIKRNIFSKKTVEILKSVSGEFKSGELSAIIGTSGAGKSTLLNIISGFTTDRVEGQIFDNAKLRNKNNYTKSCYIMQDGKLHDLLTVEESMRFSADLNLPAVPKKDKDRKTESILKSLRLYECRKTLTSKISGGERRRLSIGVELIQDPPVLFLDEPTSGLDDVAAKNLIELLRNLALEGRTIICTIHQPSAIILQKFDRLYCLFDGFCTYQGGVDDLLLHLENLDKELKCPNYHNPADFLLEVCHGVYGDFCEKLIQRCYNGANCDSFQRVLEKNCDKRVYARISDTKLNFFNETSILIRRSYKIMFRDKQIPITKILVNVIIGIVIGIMFFKIGEDGKHTLNNFSYIFFAFCWVMYTGVCTSIIAFSDELPIVIREHFNRWYSVKSYFIAVTLTDLPVQIIAMFSFLLISYFMTGQPLVWFRFNIFTILIFLNFLVAQSLGIFISSLANVKASVLLGPTSISPFIIFSGFFIHKKDAPQFLHWLFECSFVRYAMEGGVQAVMGFDRGKLYCPDLYCHFANPKIFMRQIGFEEERIALDILVLVVHFFILKLAAYVALSYRIGGKR